MRALHRPRVSARHIVPVAASLVWAVAAPHLSIADDAKAPPAGAKTQQNAVQASEPKPDAVIATYNDKKITYGELDAELKKPAFQMMFNAMKGNPEMMNQLRSSVVNQMINRSLLLDAAKSADAVKPEDVEKETQSFITAQGGQKGLEEKLKGMGLTYDSFLKDLKDDVLIKLYLDGDISKMVKVSDADAEKFFKEAPDRFGQPAQVRARHILLQTKAGSTPADLDAVKKKADDLYAQASKPGADFAALAAANSDDPGSKTRGGDLGFFGKGMMVPEFEQAAFSLKPGEVGKPVKSNFGYHIIKLEEKKDAQVPEFAKVKEQVIESMKLQEKGKLVQTKIEELRKTAKVDVKLPSAQS